MKQPIVLPNCLVLALLVIASGRGVGQTPWETAPATPAAMPPGAAVAASPPIRVVSLPPPPVSTTSQVSTPEHVPLSARPVQAKLPANEEKWPVKERWIDELSTLLPPLPDQNLSHIPLPSDSAGQSQLPPPPASVPLQLPPIPRSFPLLPSDHPGAARTPPATGTSPNSLVAFSMAEQQPPQPEEFPAGKLIAVVGTEHILAGDMAVFVEPIIEQNRSRIPSPEEEKKVRSQLARQALRQYVEIKALYQEFFRDMVGIAPPKELEEAKKKVATKAGKIFFEKQVPVLMKKYEVASLAELEKKLTEKSLSLVTLRGQFIEQALASELERKYIPEKFEIDRHDLLTAYRELENADKWNVPGRVRWRQVTIRFDKHQGREAVNQLIRELGNQMLLGGKPFEAVARQYSEGYTADQGGVYDWTTQGSLKSKELDEAIFSLPLNELSQVITDDIGMHIVEVLQREEGHTKDFTEAQSELRESLSDERRNKEIRALREKIMARTTVWTLWPEDIKGSRPLSDAIGNFAK